MVGAPLVSKRACLAGLLAVVAAGCGTNGWSLASTPLDVEVTLAPGATESRTITWEASHETLINGALNPVAPAASLGADEGARLRMDLDDAANGPTPTPPRAYFRAKGCEASFVYVAGAMGRWDGIDADERRQSTGLSAPLVGAECGKRGTFTFRVVNESEKPLTARWTVNATISEGNFDNEPPPDDAFLRASVVP